MQKSLREIVEYYVKLYQWLPAVLGLAIFVILFSCRIFFVQDQTAYFQTIFVGLVAFGIPFMWNAYQRILEVKSKSIGDKIEDILSKEYYQKANRYFEAILLFPAALIIFLGLIVSPFLSLPLVTVLIVLAVLFLIYQTRIFSWIEDTCSTNLRKYIEEKDPLNVDLVKVFREIWQKSDDSLEKDLALIPVQLLNLFTSKIDQLLS